MTRKRKQYALIRSDPEEPGNLQIVCPCGVVLPRDGYAIAQLSMGHDLLTTCEKCRRELDVCSATVRSFRFAHPKPKRKKVAP